MRDAGAQERLARARAAQRGWAGVPPGQRAAAMRPLRRAIAARMDEIVRVISEETGKPPMDALGGDVMVTLEQLRFYERNAAQILRPRRRGKPRFLFSGAQFVEVREPHGVVLVCAPWNYPLQLAVVPMATALFAGNAVLLKCSENTPRTAHLIEEFCVDAGLPADLVQVSWELPEHAAALLDAGPDLLFFTGCSSTGRAVAVTAASLMIPAVLELGGKDAALVFDSCRLERTVDGVAYGCFSNAGQVCVGTKRLFVQRGIYDHFLRLLLARLGELRMGSTLESDFGPIRFEAVRRRLREQVEDAVARGATVRTAWPPEDAETTSLLVLTGVPQDALLLTEDSFGPVVCVAPFDGEDGAIAMANASAFGLSASVWTGDEAQGERVALRLHCGSCAVNDVIRNIANPEVAFGGNGGSGHGRYHGAEGLRTFSRIKSVMTMRQLHRTEVHWFPFRARTYGRLRALLGWMHEGRAGERLKALRGLWMPMLALAAATGSACVALARCCKP